MFISYRSKVIIIFILIAIVPMIYIGFNMSAKVKSRVINEELNLRTQAINYEVEKIEMWFKDNEKLLKTIEVSYPLMKDMITQEDQSTNIAQYLKSHIDSEDSFLNLYITMKDGSPYNSLNMAIDIDTRDREWYINAYQANSIVWTQPYKDLLTGEIVITVSMPVYDQDGNIDGVLGADLNFQQVLSKFSSISINENASTYIIDPRDGISTVFGEDIINLVSPDEGYSEDVSYMLKTIKLNKIGQETFDLDQE